MVRTELWCLLSYSKAARVLDGEAAGNRSRGPKHAKLGVPRFEIFEETNPMKFVPIICLALVFATSASAAPPSVESACWRAANRVLPALNWREREAYIANCIADWTAGTPPPTGRKSYNRNRY